jgi:AraC-like DNA-binding protein
MSKSMHNTDVEFVLRANDEHHHPVVPFARFLSCETGGAWVRAARKAYCLIKGDGIWLPPALPHTLFAMAETRVREFRVVPCPALLLPAAVGLITCPPLLAAALRSPLRHEGVPARAEMLALLLITEMAAASPRRHAPMLDMPPTVSRAAPFCKKMLQQPTRETALGDIAAEVGVSIRTLNRIFRDELNTTVAAWRREVQFGRALCALNNDMPVSAVADMLGFSNSAFSTFFKSRLGYPPRYYQARR